MGSQRGFFGELPPLPGEFGSNECVVRFCQEPVRCQRFTQAATINLCEKHVGLWDSGRVQGSLVRGYDVVPDVVPKD
jgi:hypothetical protein